jgi:hypothetical protein
VVIAITSAMPTVCAVSGRAPGQALRHRLAQARARIGAGDDADQRDADLDGREELAGVGGEQDRGRRPLLPVRAIASSRAVRAETIASSDIEKTPFTAISTRMIATSIQGKGAGMVRALHIRTRPCFTTASCDAYRCAGGTTWRDHGFCWLKPFHSGGK